MDSGKIDRALVQKQELFNNFKWNEIDFVTYNSGVLQLPKNKYLFSSGQKASCFYILISGEIRVFKLNEDGREEEVARFTAGDTIGDFDFARGAEYDAFAEAAEDSSLIVFPGNSNTVESLAKKESGIVCRIMLNAIVMMTARIKSTNKLVLDNMSWVQDLHRRAYEDAGTGLWKQTLIADEIKGSLKEPAALIMLKPDRFKILVDSNGHSAGDEAMIKIALILKSNTRIVGHGWPMRFKSNEVGLIFNNFNEIVAKNMAEKLAGEIAEMEKVPLKQHQEGSSQGEAELFHFTATISWCIWPGDGADWDKLFQGNYANLLETWKAKGNTIVHYTLPSEKTD